MRICFGYAMNLLGLYNIFSTQYIRLFYNTIEGKLKWNSSQSVPIKQFVLVGPLFWFIISEFTGSTEPICPNANYIFIIDVGLIFY